MMKKNVAFASNSRGKSLKKKKKLEQKVLEIVGSFKSKTPNLTSQYAQEFVS